MTGDNISSFLSRLGASIKSLAKMALQSRRCTITPVAAAEASRPVIVMGNGPSLADTIDQYGDTLRSVPTIAVNFAANAPEFFDLKPRYYVLADPHFFRALAAADDPNVVKLWHRLGHEVTWEMTLFVPAGERANVPEMPSGVKVECFNPVGVEGFAWLERRAYSSGRGMPRPRNVLIPAIMIAAKLGYNDIYIVGADHSWMRTISVNDRNEVVTVQPHFYKDNADEAERVTSVYRNIPLHKVVLSFYVAFEAYHRIARYATKTGINIYNATPRSMIDAFARRSLAEIDAPDK